MIHKACMPVYMNSGKIVADGRDGKSKVLQEVLADLKIGFGILTINDFLRHMACVKSTSVNR